jgi:acetyltransferase-like isoleucine patch superfamily enzyme
MMASGHRADFISTYPFREISQNFSPDQSFPVGDITIGNDCWIGSDVMLLGGCTIGDGAIVGAKSLVTSNQKLEDFGVYGGSPARLLYYRFDKETRDALKKLRWWDLPRSVIEANMGLFYDKDIKHEIKQLSKLVKR